MKMIAMIPARMNSKRIPHKNLRFMGDMPLIGYPIRLALESNRFESIWVNTESDVIGTYAESLGINYHKRPEELANDVSTNREFTYEFMTQHECDYVVMVNPTSPLLRPSTLDAFLDTLEGNDFDTLLSVTDIKEEIMYGGQPLNFSFSEKVNSQNLQPVQPIVWALTAWKRSTFMSLQEKGVNPVFGGKLGVFPIPKDESCDLDTEDDWRIAEGILLSRASISNKRYLE